MYQVCLEQGQGLKASPNCSASLTPNPCPFPQPHRGGGGPAWSILHQYQQEKILTHIFHIHKQTKPETENFN